MKIFTWKQRFIVWVTTLGTILVCAGVGYVADLALGTHRIFFMLGIIGSFPLNTVLLKRNIAAYGIDKSIQ